MGGDGDFQGAKADVYDKQAKGAAFAELCYSKLRELLGMALTGSHIVDYGCGTGNHTIRMAHDGARVLGVDVSERMVELAQQKVTQGGLQDSVQLLHMTGDPAAQLQDRGPFDAAVIVLALHHAYEHVDSILTTLNSVLKSGGKLLVLEMAPTERSEHTRSHRMREMEQQAQEHAESSSGDGGHAHHGHAHHHHHSMDWLPADELVKRSKEHGFDIELSEDFFAENALGVGLSLDCYVMRCSKVATA